MTVTADRLQVPRGRPGVAMLSDVAAERRGLADFLLTLSDGDWAVPSLCPAWTVKEVVAHLVLSTRQPLGHVMWRVVRARGDFDRVVADMACERAVAYSPAELVEQLGRVRPVAAGRAVPCLEYVWGSRFYGARRRFAGLRFAATDADWSVGSRGSWVRGVRGCAGRSVTCCWWRPGGWRVFPG